jgi:hypothetical protein
MMIWGERVRNEVGPQCIGTCTGQRWIVKKMVMGPK